MDQWTPKVTARRQLGEFLKTRPDRVKKAKLLDTDLDVLINEGRKAEAADAEQKEQLADVATDRKAKSDESKSIFKRESELRDVIPATRRLPRNFRAAEPNARHSPGNIRHGHLAVCLTRLITYDSRSREVYSVPERRSLTTATLIAHGRTSLPLARTFVLQRRGQTRLAPSGDGGRSDIDGHHFSGDGSPSSSDTPGVCGRGVCGGGQAKSS